MERPTLLLVGGGGHCRSCIEVIESEGGYAISGIIEVPGREGGSVLGYPILGSDEMLPEAVKRVSAVLVTIGYIASPETRVRLFLQLQALGATLATVCASSAIVSRACVIGEGTIVMHHALVNAEARVGRNAIINSGAIVEHDARVGDHSHVSTGAVVNGGCAVGARVFLGSRAVVRNGVSVCDDVIIGAGSVVVADITMPGTYYGVPAERKQ
jgi:sugar O-acyltransferase (sialic acid O-acetyltransferase NeuD family)